MLFHVDNNVFSLAATEAQFSLCAAISGRNANTQKVTNYLQKLEKKIHIFSPVGRIQDKI